MKALYRSLFAAGILACAVFVTSCSSSKRLMEPETDWVFLAEGKAAHLREKDVFKIKSRDKFSALKLYVYHKSVSIKSVDVMLVNGDVLTPAIDGRIGAGERSRTIDLSSEGRQIEKITIRYKSDGKLFSNKALVQVGGLRPQEPRR
jgi:hypothetical protein